MVQIKLYSGLINLPLTIPFQSCSVGFLFFIETGDSQYYITAFFVKRSNMHKKSTSIEK